MQPKKQKFYQSGFRLITAMTAVFILSLFTVFAAAAPAEGGTVVGKVLDGNGNPLPGADVMITNSNLSVVSDESGRFELAGVPAGRQTVKVDYLGYDSKEMEIEVSSGRIIEKNITLESVFRPREEVTVQAAPLLEGQAKALNQQKTSLNIVNIVSSELMESFPDPNSAEATQRLPGVSIQRDQGEGRYVLIRGTESRLNSTMLNGERLPSPEGDIRDVALDVIPADLLKSIKISKALTPDMDADAIGGAVDLITKDAPDNPLTSLKLGFGYNDISQDTLQNGSFTFGRRVADGKVGFMLGGSYYNTSRGSDNFEVEYDDGFIEEHEYRDYTVNRKRYGLLASMDFQPSLSTKFRLHAMYNQFDDDEIRRRATHVVPDGEIEREIKDRFETQMIYSVAGDMEHLFSSGLKVDAGLSYSFAHEKEPDRRDTVFLQEDVVFNPNVSPDSINPDNIQTNPQNEDVAEYIFDELVSEDNLTNEKKWMGKLNFSLPISGGRDFSGLIKAGGNVKWNRKMRDNLAIEYGADDDLLMSSFLDQEYDAGTFIDGRYDMGPWFTAGAPDDLLDNYNLESEEDVEENLADYDADERIYGGYLMSIFNLGEKIMILPGIRYEYTDIDYTGYEIIFDEEGDFASLNPVEGVNNYGIWCPNLHVRFRLTDDTNFRGAVTRTISRPNYFDLTPYRLINQEDYEMELGNPNLVPTKSWNGDLMLEHYLASVGLVSAGVFYKNLDDYIYFFRYEQGSEGRDFEVTQPLNGESATLLGLELSLQSQRLSFLPPPFDGLGILLNYTYTDSEAVFPDREGEAATLPGQSSHIANAALSYEKGVFSGRLSLNYHGKYIDEVGETADEDVYYDNHLQLDFVASARISRRIEFFVEVINLTNEPLRYYLGTPDRPIQEEYYSFWGSAGLRINF